MGSGTNLRRGVDSEQFQQTFWAWAVSREQQEEEGLWSVGVWSAVNRTVGRETAPDDSEQEGVTWDSARRQWTGRCDVRQRQTTVNRKVWRETAPDDSEQEGVTWESARRQWTGRCDVRQPQTTVNRKVWRETAPDDSGLFFTAPSCYGPWEQRSGVAIICKSGHLITVRRDGK